MDAAITSGELLALCPPRTCRELVHQEPARKLAERASHLPATSLRPPEPPA